MGDKWDYKLRKVEMAWEIAQKRIGWFDVRSRPREEYEKEVEEALQKAWDTVNSVFPAEP